VAFEDRGAPSATPQGGGALPHDAVDPHGPPTLIKGFKWRDLLAPNQRGVTVRYRIVAMQGDEANATPLAGVAVLETAAVTPSPNYGAVDAYFNRGILSTQSLVRTLAHYGGASLAGLEKALLPWQREIYKAGHAVVHDKIVVIDPFHAGCVVATGSHNLGFRASYNNDENLLLVRGNQLLAQAYAAHVADVFEHYRWRWYNKRSAERAAAQRSVSDGKKPATALDRAYATANFYHAEIPAGTASGDWQARYFDPTRLASLERQFWVGGQAQLPPRQMGVGMTSGLTKDEVAFQAARAALKTKQKAKKTPTH
jgi:phosphatidylserine/phosphatidylglycerophosphate/cardiolipin synthase-like enzyme